MKRLNFLMIALLLMGSMAMAQGHRKGGDRKIDPKVRAERMTERMAKEYSLNDTQKKQLLEANQALVEKMGDGTHWNMKQGKKGKGCQAGEGCCCCCKKNDKKAPKMSKEERGKMHAEIKASREAYNVQLKKILTKEQFAAYTKKQEERQQKMKDGHPGR